MAVQSVRQNETMPPGVTTPFDGLVVTLARHGVDELVVEDHSIDGRAALHRPERLVEVAAAPAHPHAGAVDGRGRHQDQVDVVDRDRPEQLAGRGRHAEHVDVLVLAVVGRPVEQAVGARDGQQHPDAALARPAAGSRACSGSSGSGEVGREGADVEVGRQVDQVLRSSRPRRRLALGARCGCGGARGARRAARASRPRRPRPRTESKRRGILRGEAPDTPAGRPMASPWPPDHQSRHPRRRTRHPIPARDQGDAEGDAARRRQAGDPVRGRRGGRRRPAPTC